MQRRYLLICYTLNVLIKNTNGFKNDVKYKQCLKL